MYVVTFYSFKGGVGRTMALVNIGVELARMGRRVLLVDFDLEAPGIETFNLPRPRDNTPGLVDFVLRYIDTNEAPPSWGRVWTALGYAVGS
jgi:cellulose biosynthesis protein BcsQ